MGTGASMNKKHKLYVYMALLFICLAALLLFGALMPESASADSVPVAGPDDVDENILTESAGDIIFSHEDHFYDATIELALTAANADIVAIFYTRDGSLPDAEGATPYNSVITLVGNRRLNSFTIRACGQFADGSFTDIYTHTYFIGRPVSERFDTLIFCLSTDPYNLYDYDYGIAIPGRLRDQYIAISGDKEPDPPAPANYNLRGRDAERPVHVEVLDENGNLLLAQNAGMRTFGGWSRALDQKSFKLFARRSYDADKAEFHYDFFPDDYSYNGQPINAYKRLVLRNNANDNPFAFLRDEVVSSLAAAVLPDTQSSRAVSVFLNGEYYGFAWLHQVYDNSYFNDKNEMTGSAWEILSGGAWGVAADEDDEDAAGGVEDYWHMYDYRLKDLTNNRLFDELCALMDIENFLRYYALQIYVNNWDWPWGNYKVYRYAGPTDLRKEGAPYTADGRWRWLLYDTDWTLGLYDSNARDLSLGKLLGAVASDRGHAPLLVAILEREDMRARFAAILCDLMNQHFSPEAIRAATLEKEAERANELYHNFRDGGAQLKNSWSSLDFVAGQIERIITFGEERPGEMRKQIEKYMSVPAGGYDVHVQANRAARIMLSTCIIDDVDFNGFYYNISSLELSADIRPGHEFSHWLINGEAVYEENILLDRNHAIRGVLDVKLVTT